MDNFTLPPETPNFRAPPSPARSHPSQSHPSQSHPSLSSASFLASAVDIPETRDALEKWLEENTPAMQAIRRYEIVLAASELLVNAFEHGDAVSGCLFDMRRTPNKLVLTVTNSVADAQLAPTAWWTMPDADHRGGRGLAIVKSVASTVHSQVTKTAVSVTAIFDLDERTPREPSLEAKLAL